MSAAPSVPASHPTPARPYLSLRQWLTLPFVALVAGVAITIGALSYTAGSHAVDTLSEKLLLETVDRIGQAIDRHVVGSAAALEAAFPDGLTAPPSIDADTTNLRNRFWIATSLHIDPNNYVYYGNRQGQFFGLWRHSLEEGQLRIKLKAEVPRTLQEFKGLNGSLSAPVAETSVYDPRVRPWYKAGEAKQSQTWTSIYIDYRTTDLVATRARRVLDADGALAGVVATDMSLRALNDFVRRLRLTDHGLAFIVERDGNLIASSRSPNVNRPAGGQASRINAAQSSDPVERAVHAEVRRAMDASPSKTGSFSFTGPGGQTDQVAFATITDSAGLEWIVVVAVPRSDFMGGITTNVVRTALIGAAASIVAMLLGLSVLRWIGDDLGRLARAARAIGDGDMEVPVDIHRRDELGDLAECFRQMQHKLRTDALTGLINRDTVVQRIDERIRRHRQGEDTQAFAVLFIDVDNFKQVNDTQGHDVGDKVLVEIGRRLQAATGRGDLVARYAGDEFVVLLGAVESAERARQLRGTIEQLLRDPLDGLQAPNARHVAVSGSVGLALFEGHDFTAEDVIRRADTDMYERKAAAGKPVALA
jgi:diguanylate cyclase (GGDEF)-like protein